MRFVKAAVSVAIVVASWAAIAATVVGPYACNLRLRPATQQMDMAASLAPDDVRVAELARGVVRNLRTCVEDNPGDVAAQMVIASAYRALGHPEEAATAYETALLYDRRPELYLNLGETQLVLGRRDAALHNFVLACIDTPNYLDEIGDLKPEVKSAVDRYQEQIVNAER